jgi:hypothetical protein
MGAICDIFGEGLWDCAKVLGNVSGLFWSKRSWLCQDHWDGGIYRLRANISSTGLDVMLCWKRSWSGVETLENSIAVQCFGVHLSIFGGFASFYNASNTAKKRGLIPE